ncbi:hypothetical protein [Salinispora oceanensis]|uniref:hypothetical protein n=1 Tax=Salinispora oceanensis TaxID=1050199 RepID=UPI0004830572|nr:hypothetical protein [Salinispora oceanensis]
MWASLLTLLCTYSVLSQVGVADSGAASWAFTAAALFAVFALWRAARNSVAPEPEPVRRSTMARRVLALIVVTHLSTSLVSGLIGGFSPAIPPGGSPDHAMAINLRLNTTVGWPINLIIIFQLGRLSGTWLAVRRPFRWLAMISVFPALIALALHPVVIAFSQKYGTIPPHSLAEKAPRMIAGTVLIFCVLALGNLSRRESLRRPRPAASRGGGTIPGLGDSDTGHSVAPDRATP